ncbi:hypothetical protein BKA65DRAFT_394804 [Rhexocercosporidium sp. MPI-PUGE-AT-0058]|nr:hypothetical protein BKA65DRAFT_394804 [Rhexocercosporidium sp. MPI-PUGE-AT-0058]
MDPVSVVGLAASVLQLGTFVVESMGTLKKIRDSLKTGNADLRRIQQSISDHQRTLEWLRIICSKTSVQTSGEEELLDQLQASIKQSEDNVAEFSNASPISSQSYRGPLS